MVDRLNNPGRTVMPARLFSAGSILLCVAAVCMIAWHAAVLAGIPRQAAAPASDATPPDWGDALPLMDSPEAYVRGLPIEIFTGSALETGQPPVLSDLQVTVIGTDLVVQSNGAVEEAFAIIRDDRTMVTGVFAVGQAIADAVILRIQANEVLVRRENGRQEILRFLDQSAIRSPGLAAGPLPSVSPQIETGRAAKIVHPVNKFRRQINREEALVYIAEVFSDLSEVSAYATGFKPMLQGNNLQGFMLGNSLPKDMLEATGLQSGDIIRRVNSLELDSTSKIDYFFDEFSGERLNAIVLDIERSGVRTNMVYTVE